MKTGFAEAGREFKRNWHWRGRRYWGGLMQGVAMGVFVGIAMSIGLDLKDSWSYHLVGIFLAITILNIVGNYVVGKAPTTDEAGL